MFIRYISTSILALLSFTVTSAQLPVQLFFPNGGETLRGGSKVNITWQELFNVNSDSVLLELSVDGGSKWTRIADPVVGSSYEWTVPYLSSTTCRVRATQVAGERRTGSRVHLLSNDSSSYTATFSRDGALVAQMRGRRASIWYTATGELLRTIQFEDFVYSLSFSPDGARIVIAINSRTNPRAEIWEVASGTKLFTLPAPRDSTIPSNIWNEIWWNEYSPDGSRIAMATKFSLSFWDAATGTIIDSILEFYHNRISYSGNGQHLFTNENGIEVRDPGTGVMIKRIAKGYTISDISYDGKFVLAISSQSSPENDTLFLVDVEKETVRPIRTWKGNNGPPEEGPSFGGFIHGTPYVMAGRILDNELVTFDPSNGRVIGHINQGPLRAITIHPDKIHVAVLTEESPRKLELWSINPFDISDSNFTIESSRRLLPTVTFAGVKVGAELDTTLAMYVRNTGSSPMAVNEIAVASGHVGDFTVLDAGGFSLAPGEGRDIRVRFRPADRGDRSAWLEARTTADTIVGEVRGIGLKGRLLPITDRIRFGDVKINQPRDLWTHTFKNAGTAPLRIDSLNVVGSDRRFYSIIDGPSLPFTIQMGDTHALTLRCSLSETGQLSDAVLIYDDEYGEKHQIYLGSNGVYQLGVDDDAAIAGRTGLLQYMMPNPASMELRIGCKADAGDDVIIELVDLIGNVVHAERYLCSESGVTELKIDVRRVPAGTYVGRVVSSGKSDARLVVVQR